VAYLQLILVFRAWRSPALYVLHARTIFFNTYMHYVFHHGICL